MVTTILLVEDEEPLRRLLTNILQSYGWNVHAVGSGQEALDFCEQHEASIDVLITDLLVTHPIGGAQLSSMLLYRYPQMQIIITSGYGEKELARHVPVAKHAFLQKPFSGALVIETVVEALRGQKVGYPATVIDGVSRPNRLQLLEDLQDAAVRGAWKSCNCTPES